MMRLLIVGILLAAVSFSSAAKPLSNQEISEFGGCYFAPVTSDGLWRMRTQDGKIREFEPGPKKNILVGVGGWWASVQEKGQISVHAPATGDYPPVVYNFQWGRLSSLDVEGKHCRFNYPKPLVYDESVILPLWPEAKEISKDAFAATTKMWKDGRRLTLWFPGPNQAGAFLSFLFLIFWGLSVRPAIRRGWRVCFLLFAAVFFVVLVLTASRSAFLGTALGVVVMHLFDRRLYRFLSWRRVLIIASISLLLSVGAICAIYATGRSRAADSKSDETRVELYQTAPVMMRDAPLGWGGFSAVGKAYSDWYAKETETKFRLNLVSDHLTMLAGNGWFGGFCYLWLWFAGLALGAVFCWRGGSGIPLALWTSLGVVASLNVVLFAPTILWLPLASLLFLAQDRRWLKKRLLVAVLAVGALAALVCLAVIYVVADFDERERLFIRKDGERILVNGEAPDIWIVDDEESIGGVLAPRDIRAFYRRFPDAPAIGYIKRLSDLPSEGVKRIILVGDAAQDFMVPYTRKPESVRVPREIVFLSPQFPPSAIPDDLRGKATVIMVIGEFAARYWEDFVNPPDWVDIVRGAEVYIPNWMMRCVETRGKE